MPSCITSRNNFGLEVPLGLVVVGSAIMALVVVGRPVIASINKA